VVETVLTGPATLPGVRVLHGKSVVELSVVDADKGEAVRRLAREVDADVAVAIGDDETDEWMFAALAEGSVSIKVGPGETGARFRVAGVDAVVALVNALVTERAAYLAAPD
jgi:trehalose 6-phosphate phosphatase